MKNKKIKNIALVSILALAIGGGVYLYTDVFKSSSGVKDITNPTRVQIDAKQAALAPTSVAASPAATSTKLAVEGITFSQSSGLVLAGFRVNDGRPGRCTFMFTSPDSPPISKEMPSAETKPQVCKISINEVEFTKLGTWHMAVSFKSDIATAEGGKDVNIN